MEPTYLKPKALSDRWGISTVTLGQWRWNGKGPQYLKMGRHIKYPLKDIEEFERTKRRRSTSDNKPANNQARLADPSGNGKERDLKNAPLPTISRRG